ncbi:MAG: hypothetical protein KJ795_11300 [Gammaproteobacteria bacterium]|nr:hypothetical protein [Gammaproteobacteria bacterium]MBU1776920.1 hypothetical protein [Gammaproteobacteria bacterium]MBU1968605.1 hypothetical protein [Gammaproteobacteria bacterium]
MKKRILLIDPFAGAARMPDLAAALKNAGADVRELDIAQGYDAVLDALEDGFMPVVLKVMQRS